MIKFLGYDPHIHGIRYVDGYDISPRDRHILKKLEKYGTVIVSRLEISLILEVNFGGQMVYARGNAIADCAPRVLQSIKNLLFDKVTKIEEAQRYDS